MPAPRPVLLLLAATTGLAAAWAAGCYTVPDYPGPYRCSEGSGCAAGLLCDDGVCCNPTGEPLCLSYVLDGGRCADGGTPKTFYDDLDEDGFGNDKAGRPFCARPVTLPVSATAGDCNDTPELGQTSFPGAAEQCDGLDNDCDGTPDDGLPTQTFYEDQDNDKAGDPARPRPLCAPAPGYARVANDCAPNDGTRHPQATERCNGLDDNCNGSADENPADVNQDCDVPGGKGVCAKGKSACLDGGLRCVPPAPQPDECDGIDNDCDGTADQSPDCGGPSDLLNGAGLSYGARDLKAALNGGYSVLSCVKDYAGGVGEFFSKPRWQGSGATSHVFWVENSRGTWDLSRAGAKLRVVFNHSMFKFASVPWSSHGQPVVYLCDSNGGHLRFVHFDGGTSTPVMSSADGTVDEVIPLAGNASWVVGANANLDIRHVKRVEVLVQPMANSDGGVPTFSIEYQPGFGFQP